ncbi:MAG: M20 family metallo-hydrolase [Chloroflexaceae bacterium]|jgi:N-carbamoyl-L-amino-acid hydrolase|nr:M20 family metallo-hydrolase [Chloroflexaceae bacterium]
MQPLTVDTARLQAELDQLATYSSSPAPGVTRVLWSTEDMQARNYVKQLCGEAGLSLREDSLGTLFARWEGSAPELAAVASGSHIDAIPNAGRYDGTVGVLGVIEAIRALQRAGVQPRRSIELIMFTSEEPTRFGLGCLGSRAMAGTLSSEQLLALRDGEGRSLDEVRAAAGYTSDLAHVRLEAGGYSAFVELHIEQGPLLEAAGIPIGVVRAIAAPASLRLTLTGEGGHAGAVLMPQRRDALLAGAEIALAVERAALATGSPDTVATTGVFRVEPGAINSIPSRALLEIDVRDVALEPRNQALAAIESAINAVCKRRGIGWELTTLNADPPAPCASALVGTVEAVCQKLQLPYQVMVSRAYHDSLFMARLCPVTMIFIPCRNGVSHRPDEYAAPDDIGRGVAVLAHTLARLSTGE